MGDKQREYTTTQLSQELRKREGKRVAAVRQGEGQQHDLGQKM